MSTTYTASQAALRAKATYSWPVGYCLKFCWNCIAAPDRYGLFDADEAWARATQKVRTGTPPAGAPIYSWGGEHGHIFMSLGGGKARSTDYPYKGHVGTATINEILEHFYGPSPWDHYRGWSRDFAGDPIPGLQAVWHAPVPAKPTNLRIDVSDIRPLRRDTSTTTDIARFKALLWRRMSQAYRDKHWASWNAEARGYWGPVGQQVLFDLYAWLTKSAGWEPVSKTGGVWPGNKVVINVGGIPI